jgi:hypothetical protein
MDARWQRYCAAIQLIIMNDAMTTARRADVQLPNSAVIAFASALANYDQATRKTRQIR